MLVNYNQALKYAKYYLSIAKELGDKEQEGRAYRYLGSAFHRLGDYYQGIEYFRRYLGIAEEVENRKYEADAYKSLGTVYLQIGKRFQAMQYLQECLNITKAIGDEDKEASAYNLISIIHLERSDFQQAKEYQERALSIAKRRKNRPCKAEAYHVLGHICLLQNDFERAKEYHDHYLTNVKEKRMKDQEAYACYLIGLDFENSGALLKAVDYYQRSIKLFNELRVLQNEDAMKITFHNARRYSYAALWRTLLGLSKFDEALCVADQGRAQALLDLVKLRYGSKFSASGSVEAKPAISERISNVSGPTLFVALQGDKINLWVVDNKTNVTFTQKKVKHLLGDATDYLKSLRKKAYEEVREGFRVVCKNRKLGEPNVEHELSPTEERGEETVNPSQSEENPLRLFYECIISPISNLIKDGELIVVPDGPLCLAPFAAFLDSESKYLSESMRIRILPSLMCMKLIHDFPEDYHRKSGALLVGDPCLEDFTTLLGENRYFPLPFAKKEVEMIGAMLGLQSLTGKEATKAEVLKRIGSVALVHIAALGKIETGEIALAPNPQRKSETPEEQDFRLTISDVQAAKLLVVLLVVLSRSHSAQGKVSSEGVVGIARAFLGAGARSVLVALWSIDDEATMEFMRSFYQQLKYGNSASVSLNRAMKCLRESENFNAPRFWAPFVLIGDDVTIDFGEIHNEL